MTGRTAISAFAATLAIAATPAAAFAQDAPAEPAAVDPAVAAAAAPRAGAEQVPPTTTTPTPTPPAPRRAVRRARARIGTSFESGVYRVGSSTLTVPGRVVHITGRIVPYVPGQKVRVRIWLGDRLAKQVTVTPKPTKTKQTATFRAKFTAGKLGDVRVFAVHEQSPQQAAAQSKAASVAVVAPLAGFGTNSPFVALLQQKLADLGYAVPRSGVYDAGTGDAVEAYRKVLGSARLKTIDGAVVDKLLRGQGGFKIRYPDHGRHVEANLSQQVLALIENGRVLRTYTTSSGASVTPTVLGNYRFYWKQPGVNNRGMVHSSYFIRGYAIHGYPSVPTYPASHGCLRVPIRVALDIYNWVQLGDQIDVYY
ncbi:L,D-transpeptidase family protein [Conexibacter stalactiti]|uniref:L,D-transpeptidase family protein n=1 Tax=Conexibacter stalactiti TaxID=1940611 RepID=A0ABU4HJ17_9ACTN|nr:L,D-transpeptidase family protein [Conexibacter stalactiti]MDW5593311.1 L,D-transpeptidase family protein [Conexibacter stalactiti]MEC5033952.1 L,D-transpeptidase family protein [Conexibacter stalactiti]